jgi:hypothetical protein
MQALVGLCFIRYRFLVAEGLLHGFVFTVVLFGLVSSVTVLHLLIRFVPH